MTRKQSAFAVGGLILGASLVARQLRRLRAIDLAGRIVLITGGSRGLGLLMAREVGRLGAHVVIAARDEAELLRAQRDLLAHDIEVSTLVADVATEAQAQRMISNVLERHGRLDMLINNAGVIMVGPVDHMNVADFEEAMATHFWGPLHTMLAAIPHMRENGGGRIVNISSIGGKIGVPHLAPYCASKFALTGVSTALRTELARYDILVTTVSRDVTAPSSRGSPSRTRCPCCRSMATALPHRLWMPCATATRNSSSRGRRASRWPPKRWRRIRWRRP